MSFLLLAVGAFIIGNMAVAGPLVDDNVGRESLTVYVSAEQETAGARDFIANMTQRGIDFLGDENMTDEDRRREFRQLLNDSFDLNTIGRFALGRNWKTASQSQRNEYLSLFKKMVVNVYSNRFEEYQGQELEVKSARQEGKDWIVSSFITSKNNPDVSVDWRVRKKGGQYKVIDVIVEGVSMTLTQRSDFASVIQKGGGDVEVLLEHLRK